MKENDSWVCDTRSGKDFRRPMSLDLDFAAAAAAVGEQLLA